jgi:cellulose synthase/poly-beta-1,6-N-acetylglucosamine synthase-like glycosyltransferase
VLAAALLCALGAALVSTSVLLFRQHRLDGGSRSTVAAAVAVVASGGAAVALPLLGATTGRALTAGLVCSAASALWLPRTTRWRAAAHVMWASTCTAGACFLAYTAIWTVVSRLGVWGTIGGTMLWLLELSAYLLSLAYLWEMIDAIGSRSWSRRHDTEGCTGTSDSPLPIVSIHVPAHNEPPDMVIETLRSLLALDYPAFEVHLIDNNTDDESLWRPVERFCAEHPDVLRFHHLAPWPGYKSGALNYALTVTDVRAELIAIVDADYIVEPNWLRAVAPMFVETDLGFVQSPQDYRGWEDSAYFRRLYHSYDYFFRVSQRSRDERNAAIFGGTMGVVRRSALEAVGGWDEWCITEDAELSLRLNAAGWAGRQVDRSFGRGVMPLTFESLKGQRFRWCFGGIQILRLHWRQLMPWNRDPDNRLTRSQRLAYLSGGLQWLGDLAGLAFLAFVTVGGLDLVLGSGIVLRRMSPLLLVVVPSLTTLALVRAVAVVRAAGGGSWREAAGALGIWLALGFTVARACIRGATEPEGVFLRTPKTKGDTSLANAVLANRTETALGVGTIGLALLLTATRHDAAALIMAAMLLIAGAGHLSAPFNSVAAMRADLPERLSRRRRTERTRAWARVGTRQGTRIVLVAGAIGVATAAVLVLAPSTARDSTPTLSDRPGTSPLLGGAAKKASKPKASHSSAPPSPATTPTTAGSSPATTTPVSTTTATATTTGSASTAPTPISSSAAPTLSTSAPTPAGPGNSTVTPSSSKVPTAQPTQVTTSRGRPSSNPTPTTPRPTPTHR